MKVAELAPDYGRNQTLPSDKLNEAAQKNAQRQ
jgi:hypothetical protein